MKHLSILDLAIVVVYVLAMLLVGLLFFRKNRNTDQFTKASGKIPEWAVGVSMYATFLSSNTFLGVPGKAFGSNWNSFVFSLSMPFAAWIAARFFIPFYRRTGEISAYTHFENRFGPWARTYTVVCFLLTQLARMGSVFFGIAITLQALTGYSMQGIMIVMGLVIMVYTMLGGMAAVIWTEVAQAVIKTLGAAFILYFIVVKMPGGAQQILDIGKSHGKFSLGGFNLDLRVPGFWVTFFYGLFINLNNFGMDQNYIQRYHTTGSSKDAAKSLWLCVKLYLPVSLLFFIIGTSLYAWYQIHPGMLEAIKIKTAADRLPAGASMQDLSRYASGLAPQDYGDKVLPDFMVHILPIGITGLIVSAILSAAMSTISSGMNASATVFTFDIYQRYVKRPISAKGIFRVLLLATFVIGGLATITGLAMIGAKSILDLWWDLSGIFAAGMLGLFLLGLVSRKSKNREAMLATIIGIIVVAWMSLSKLIPEQYSFLRNSMNTNMTIVVGTLTIFLSGIGLSSLRR